jgi:hypothetical protein
MTFRFPIAVEKAAVGKAGRSRKSKTECVMVGPREKKEKETDYHLHVVSMGERVSLSSSTCLSDLSGYKAVVQGGPKDSVKKGAHLWPSNEDERACETRGAHPAREVWALKQHGVGEGASELGVDFTSLVLEAHPLEDTLHTVNSAHLTNQNPAPRNYNLFDFTDEGNGAHIGVGTTIVTIDISYLCQCRHLF